MVCVVGICPLDGVSVMVWWCVDVQSELDALVRDAGDETCHSSSSLSADMKQTFDRWYSDQMTSSRHQHAHRDDDDDDVDGHHATSPACRLSNGHSRPVAGHGHGRTWFDPVTEIPQLQRWLRHNTHPTRADMARYARELNAAPHRQALQRPLDVNNIAYWFKNARARASTRPSPAQRSTSSSPLITHTDNGIAAAEPPSDHTPATERRLQRVPELPNSNAVYVVPPHVTDDVTDVASRKRRRRSCESDENHNRRCTSSMSSSSVGLDDDDDDDDDHHDSGEAATDLSVRRTGTGTGSSSSSDDRPNIDDHRASATVHPALASSTPAAPLSLPLHVQQALQQQMQLAMRYMQHPLYAAPVAAAPAQRWLPWLAGSAAAKPEHDDDSSTAGSTSGAVLAPAAETSGSAGELRRKRSRVFIDPLSEIPRLEQWFAIDSHPSSTAIERLTDELNRSAYRQRFPPLEPKNVQLWFKNHRAKVKRQSLESLAMTSQMMSDVKDDVKLPASSTPLPSNHYSTASDVMVMARDEAVS